MIAAAVAVKRTRLARTVLPVVGSIILLPVVLLGAAGGAILESEAASIVADGDAAWDGDIPAEMAALYAGAASRYAVPYGVLAAVGKVETDHCRNPRSLVPNHAGAVGCMQFLPSTFERWAGASGSPNPSITDPTDSVYASAAKLSADGVAVDPWRALWAYNHSDAYVADVLAWAVAYGWRSGSRAVLGRAVLEHPRIRVRAKDRADLREELVDTRVLSVLLALATRYEVGSVGPFTQHHYYVNGTRRPSNHVFGRAVDIFAINGAAFDSRNDAARRFVVDALALPVDIRPTEVLSPWPLEVNGAWSVTDGDHADHAHFGFRGDVQ